MLIALYAVPLLIASPIYGWYVGRSSSRRFPMTLGLFALGSSTVLFRLSSSISTTVVGRVFEGFVRADSLDICACAASCRATKPRWAD